MSLQENISLNQRLCSINTPPIFECNLCDHWVTSNVFDLHAFCGTPKVHEPHRAPFRRPDISREDIEKEKAGGTIPWGNPGCLHFFKNETLRAQHMRRCFYHIAEGDSLHICENQGCGCGFREADELQSH